VQTPIGVGLSPLWDETQMDEEREILTERISTKRDRLLLGYRVVSRSYRQSGHGTSVPVTYLDLNFGAVLIFIQINRATLTKQDALQTLIDYSFLTNALL